MIGSMNPWEWAATALLLALVPCGVVILRRGTADGLAALQLAGLVATLVLLLLAAGTGRPSTADLALAMAVLAFPSGLVFAFFLERWL
jgi:multicomponent Na+:H+ antiporter subunit F